MTVNGHGWEARYRQALLDQPAVSQITLANGQLVEVKDVYVNRTLLHEVVQKQPEPESDGGRRTGTKDAESQREITVKLPVDLWPKLRDERVVLIEGPAGMGKSTLTKQLVRESGAQHRIPIWIPFRQFVASGLSIAEYLDQYYIPWLGLSDLRVSNPADETGRDRSLGQWCYDQWQSGLGVLILDGLDEVFRHEERVAALKGLPITGTDRTRPATILTSRPLSQSLLLQRAKVDLQGLTPSDQTKLVNQYKASLRLTEEQIGHFTRATTERGHSRFRELLTRPGHLIQILTTYAKTNTILDSETAVLNSLLESRLTVSERSQPSVEGGDAKKKRQVLMSLALHLLACRKGQRQTRAQLLALIQQVLLEQKHAGTPLFPLSQATALLNDFTRNSGLLREVEEVESEAYECETVIWLQHLTGTALADQVSIATQNLTETQVLDFLDKKAWDPEWEPVLKSWVGQAHNPLPLFDCLMKEEHDDLARHRLGVAGRCLVEVRRELRPLAQYKAIAMPIRTESFAVWKMNGERLTEKLVTTSLENAWVETGVGQAQLLALLQGPSSIRRAAVKVLSGLGMARPISVQQAVVARLADRNLEVREAAIRVLVGLGTAMAISVQEALVGRLADRNLEVREAAIRVLVGLGTAMAISVQEALVARLEDPDEEVREAAIRVLGELGTAMAVSVQEALMARLADPDEEVREAACEALGEVGMAMAVSVQVALMARLADPDEEVREAAYEALGELGMAIPVPIQEALVARLADPDRAVRLVAIRVLGELETAMPVFVQDALMVRLTDSGEEVREAACKALGKLGAAMPVLVQEAFVVRLADWVWTVRKAVINALGGLGTAMPVLVQEALVAWLVDRNWTVREAVVNALAGLGPAMPVAVQEALVARLADSNEDVREAVVNALAGLGPAMPVAVQEVLVTRLADPSWTVRQAAVRVLGELRPAMSVPIQEALVARLADSNEDVCEAVVNALGGLGPAMSVPVQEVLVTRLTDPSWTVRQAAVRVLGELGLAMSVPVQEAFVVRLADPSWAVRQAAVRVLGELGPAMSVPVQEALLARLADSNEAVRGVTVETLSSVQQQGLRLFLRDSVVVPGRLVSELSVTAPFPDSCHHGVLHAPSALTLVPFSRLPVTAL